MTRGWRKASLDWLFSQAGHRLTARQLRLFACACARDALGDGSGGRSAEAIALAERFADGQATAHQLASARFGGRFQPGHAAWAVCWAPDEGDLRMAERAVAWLRGLDFGNHPVQYRRMEEKRADLLREIVEPLFLSPPPAPVDALWLAWDDGTIPRLARSIYDERAFERMPILGDALEEAGCADQALLEHCRDVPREHVRGCWVLDRLLGLG